MTSECVATISCDFCRAATRSQLTVDRVLKNHVQVRVRLVEQQHRTRSRVQHRQQHQHLLKPASGAGDVEPGPVRRDAVFGDDVRARSHQEAELIAEQPSIDVLQLAARPSRDRCASTSRLRSMSPGFPAPSSWSIFGR